jgi:hypothetical protein
MADRPTGYNAIYDGITAKAGSFDGMVEEMLVGEYGVLFWRRR